MQWIALAGTAGVVITGAAFTRPAQEEEHFKNLQVLSKNISDEDMDRVMETFQRGLGVTCLYCHPLPGNGKRDVDFASDAAPEKRIAREMLRMTIGINRKYFGVKLDRKISTRPKMWCTTCHRGFPRPLNNPIPRAH